MDTVSPITESVSKGSIYKNARQLKQISSIVLSTNMDVSEVFIYHRTVNNLRQIDIASRMKIVTRPIISKFEHNHANIAIHTFNCLLIDANLHPIIKKREDAESDQVSFYTKRHPEEGYSKFISTALNAQQASIKELLENTPSRKKLVSQIPADVVQDIIDKKITDEDISKHRPLSAIVFRVQLLLGVYPTGINIAKIMRNKRQEMGLRQKDLAIIAGISLQSVSNFESEVAFPGASIWTILMIALEMHPNYIKIANTIPTDAHDVIKHTMNTALKQIAVDNVIATKATPIRKLK